MKFAGIVIERAPKEEQMELIPPEIGALRRAVDSLGNGYHRAQGSLTEKVIIGVIRAQQLKDEKEEQRRLKREQRAAKRLGKLLEEAGYDTELANELIKAWASRPQAVLEPQNLAVIE